MLLAPLPSSPPFSLHLRVCARQSPAARPLFRQNGHGGKQDGFLIEEMADGGLRATFAFERPGAWPPGQIDLCNAQQKFMAGLPYWRQPGDIERGLLRVCVPGHLLPRNRWHHVVFSHDGYRLSASLDGVLIDEEWPYGQPAVGPGPVEQLSDGWELADDGWTVEPRGWTEAEDSEWAARSTELLGPEEPFGAYWRPRGINTSVGDVMLCHDGRSLHVLALLDRRNSGATWSCGAHRFGHWTTGDLRTWQEHPQPLTLEAAAEGAIGTGGMFFDGKRYHLWGNLLSNRVGSPATETHPHRVVRATSTDGIHFQREAGPWLEGCEPGIWRESATGQYHLVAPGRRFESPDLVTWTEADSAFLPPPARIGNPINDPTGECYGVFAWNDWIYIVGGRSGFWMARDIRGPFWPGPAGEHFVARPRWSIYDGTMVPQGVVVHDNRCLLVGWIVDRWWGGRLIFRELRQLADGTLALGWVPEMTPAVANPVPLEREGNSPSDGQELCSLTASPGQHATQSFVLPPGDAHLEFRFRPASDCTAFGLCVRATADYRHGRELRLDPPAREARWGTPDGGPAPRRDSPPSHAEDFGISNVEGLAGEVTVRLILRDWVVDAWINGERTILTRQHEPAGDRVHVFVESGTVQYAVPLHAPLPMIGQ